MQKLLTPFNFLHNAGAMAVAPAARSRPSGRDQSADHKHVASSCRAYSILCASILVYSLYALHTIHHLSPFDPYKLFLNNFGSTRNNVSASRNSTSDVAVARTNISHIVFGISGSASSWEKRGRYVELWWRPNVTRGFVWLDRPPTGRLSRQWPSTSPPYRVDESVSRFAAYDEHEMPYAIRMTRVVLQAFKLRLPDARWFVMADDDTLLFVDNLVDVLAGYDHRGYHYIGGVSECVGQNYEHSFSMAFGGAGVAISYPLARELSRILDGCILRYPKLYGSDHVIQSCIQDLGVSLTRLPGFHQLDLRGDISGLLSAHPQAPVLSFHHLDDVDPIFPSMTRYDSLRRLADAARLDSSRLLQQAVCYETRRNWSLSMSWGYSVQIYEAIHPPSFLQIPVQTFKSWLHWIPGKANQPFMFNVRPPPKEPCEDPHLFFFSGAKRVDHSRGVFVTQYARSLPPAACRNRSANSVSRIEVVSPATRLQWDGRRRECCSVVHEEGRNFIQIRLRSCMQSEALNEAIL